MLPFQCSSSLNILFRLLILLKFHSARVCFRFTDSSRHTLERIVINKFVGAANIVANVKRLEQRQHFDVLNGKMAHRDYGERDRKMWKWKWALRRVHRKYYQLFSSVLFIGAAANTILLSTQWWINFDDDVVGVTTISECAFGGWNQWQATCNFFEHCICHLNSDTRTFLMDVYSLSTLHILSTQNRNFVHFTWFEYVTMTYTLVVYHHPNVAIRRTCSTRFSGEREFGSAVHFFPSLLFNKSVQNIDSGATNTTFKICRLPNNMKAFHTNNGSTPLGMC